MPSDSLVAIKRRAVLPSEAADGPDNPEQPGTRPPSPDDAPTCYFCSVAEIPLVVVSAATETGVAEIADPLPSHHCVL